MMWNDATNGFPPWLKTIPIRILVTLLLTVVLFSLRFLTPVGADGWFMANLVESGSWQFYYRSILTVVIHNFIYTILHPFGINGWNAIAISSSLAGAVAIQTLFTMKRDPIFLAVNILAGSFLVFAGHVENYAWVNTFLLLCFLQVKYNLENRGSLWLSITFYLLACLSHMLAIFYAPAILYFVWRKKEINPLEILIPVIAFTSTIVILCLGFTMLGTDIGTERLVPFFEKTAKNHHFTFFSWAHLEILFYFHRHAAFLGIPLELPLLFFFRKYIQTDYDKFLLLCVLCGLFWTTIWHPDWGRHDWDLFSQFGIPLHVLLGCILSERFSGSYTQFWPFRKKS